MNNQYVIVRFNDTENQKRKEGNVLFNDALNTFIYGYMVIDIW